MKYLKLFKIHSDYEEYINGEGAVLPNVSYTEDSLKVYYNPIPHDYSKDYLTMIVTVGGDVTWTGTGNNALYYSKDNGNTWSEPSVNITLSVNEGDKVLWKGETSPSTFNGIGVFNGSTDVRYTVEGNIMSLLFGDDFKGQTSLQGKAYTFSKLFHQNIAITSAENLSLPATTPVTYCYSSMFSDCTNLVYAPKVLPAETLVEGCYSSMFYGCSSLVTAPELPATTLASQCYQQMFQGCSSLVTVPELPATSLASGCYSSMFQGCTSLVTAPELPATTLAIECYMSMFQGCTSLVTAPELPAETLIYNCYSSMFSECTSLNYIKALFTTTPGYPTGNWVYGVASTGTFVKNSTATWSVTGVDGIPSGWTVVNA